MKNRLKDIKRYLWDVLLFSGIGCFSYFLLVYYADIPSQYQDRLMTFQAFSAVVVLFNGVGLSVKYINEKLMMYYQFFLKNHRMLSIGLITAAIILFISNYLLLVSTKLLIESPHPFMLKDKGLYVMLTVWFIELIIVGQFMLNRFYVDLVKLYKRAEELEEKTAQARYMALQNQLNPHFLFNSLNTLISEIEYNPMNAIEFTRNLADTYRYILYCQDKHTIPLREELDFLNTYILLQKVRLGDCLNINNTIDEKYWDVPIPPLTLQLLIENVIKHNIISLSKPMEVKLTTEVRDKEVWLSVSNPIKLKQGVASSGKGLMNLSQRYKLLCNRELIIENNKNKFVGNIFYIEFYHLKINLSLKYLYYMNKIKAVIIEDEFPAVRLLNKMIQKVRPEWEVTVLPGTIEGAVSWFNENPHPDIIFLDIQLNDGISFTFIEQAQPQSMIVFTTAYDEYAVRAFTVNSIDYLLKPIHEERLLEAILKFERLFALSSEHTYNLSNIEQLLKSFAEKKEKQFRTRFLISGPKHLYTVQVSDIAYFYSEDKITFAVTKDAKTHVIDFPLNKLEEQLDDRMFFRANRQFILSADAIKSIQNHFNGKAVVSVIPPYSETIYISREKVSLLKMWLNS